MNDIINENIKGSQTIAVEDAGRSIFYYEERERLTELVCFIGYTQTQRCWLLYCYHNANRKMVDDDIQ